jgi:class 3 adenylate cyclase/ABC-type transport system involved in cytochrome c biogenesis ATPase subunit
MDVGGWLRSLGLGQYEALFRTNEIDADILPELTEVDFEKLGVPLGHRKRLLRAISGLTAVETSAEPSASTGAKPEPAAERRQLTVMFCDLVGSTALSARLDPEDLRGIIGAYHRGVTEIVEGFGGFVARYMGDGVLVYFGYPRAHEDDAERATRCGLALVDWVPQLDQVEEFQARVGIATGLVVVGGEVVEHDVAGDTPNLAARLQALAEPGQIVIAGATRRLIGDLFRLTDLGPQTAKGFAEPIEAFAVEDVAVTESRFEAARRGLTDLVGRAAESVLLRNRLRAAWSGAGQIILLSGEAGIGKSRLAAQLAAEVANEPHTRLRYQCSPYHRDSVLHPFVVQLGRAARLTAEDAPETQLNKLEAILAPARIAETAPLFASLLSIPTDGRYPPLALSAAQQRRLTLAALLDQLEALARQKPVLMLFEDVHWADATSLEVLDLTVERVRALPVLALFTFRPEYEAPWTGLSHVTSIALERLAPAEVETLAEHVAGRPLPPEVTAQIVAKTDGVPLFVEELTKTVLEGGLLVAGPQGWRLDGPLPPFAIPATLQDSLAARLDRLAPVKEIAQIGAAIGREFSYPLLRAVAGRDESALRAALAQLEEAELLLRSGAPPDAHYTFKHALVQDTAYETLLRSRRHILHRQIADALCGEFAAVAAAEPELVAHHLTQAGRDEPAVEWWGKAGDQALRRSAFKEAASHLGKAIELADKLAATAPSVAPVSNRLRLQTSLGIALIWAKGHYAPETAAAFARARELANRVEDASERFSPITVFGRAITTAANPDRCAKWPSFSCAKPRPGRIVPRPWSHTAFPAPPAFISATLSTPMSIFKRVSNSTTRHGMAILPTGSSTILVPRRKFATPSHYGRWVESTILCALPTAPSPTPSLQRMLRQGVCAHICGLARAFAAKPGSSRDLQPSVGRYRISIRSPRQLGRVGGGNRIFSGLGKAVRGCGRIETRRDATQPRHPSGARSGLALA